LRGHNEALLSWPVNFELLLSAVLQFPEPLRQHLLGILHRAGLLVQLREISKLWKAQGLAKPTGKPPCHCACSFSLALPIPSL